MRGPPFKPSAKRKKCANSLNGGHCERSSMQIKLYWSYNRLPELSRFNDEERKRIWNRACVRSPFAWQPWVAGGGAIAICLAYEYLFYDRGVRLIGFEAWRTITRIIILAVPAAIYRVVNIAAIRPYIREALPGRCQSCGYDLTHNKSGVCPECGTSISEDLPARNHSDRPTGEHIQRNQGDGKGCGFAVLVYAALLLGAAAISMIAGIVYLITHR